MVVDILFSYREATNYLSIQLSISLTLPQSILLTLMVRISKVLVGSLEISNNEIDRYIKTHVSEWISWISYVILKTLQFWYQLILRFGKCRCRCSRHLCFWTKIQAGASTCRKKTVHFNWENSPLCHIHSGETWWLLLWPDLVNLYMGVFFFAMVFFIH